MCSNGTGYTSDKQIKEGLFTPIRAAEALKTILETDEKPSTLWQRHLQRLARPLEGLCRWIAETVDCFHDRLDKLESGLQSHIRGDLDTPFGKLRGPGPLLHEPHPHAQKLEEHVLAKGGMVDVHAHCEIPMGPGYKAPRYCPDCGRKLRED